MKTSKEEQKLWNQIEQLGGQLTLAEKENKELVKSLQLLLGIYDGGAVLSTDNRNKIEKLITKK